MAYLEIFGDHPDHPALRACEAGFGSAQSLVDAVGAAQALCASGFHAGALPPMVVTRYASRHGELAFLSMFTTFGTPHSVTLASLRIEFLFPADDAHPGRAWAGVDPASAAGTGHSDAQLPATGLGSVKRHHDCQSMIPGSRSGCRSSAYRSLSPSWVIT